jgi:hypothetical protein
MKRPAVKRGFKAVKEEEKRREQAREASKGKLWRIFFPKDADEDFEIPVRFLTDEPVCFHEHSRKVNGKFTNVTCTGDDCEECADGDKPRFVGAFLVLDRTEFTYEERDEKGNKTGKKLKGKDRLKLLVRGSQDLAKLDKLNSKHGLLDRDWTVYKTGKDTTTTWNFDKGDLDEMSAKELKNILPEKYRGKDFYEIVEEQIMGSDSDEDEDEDDAPRGRNSRRSRDEDEDEDDVQAGVQSLDDEDEEDEAPRRVHSSKTPSKSPSKTPNKAGAKTPSRKPTRR